MKNSQKILLDALGLASVLGLGFASYKIYGLLKKPKNNEVKSNFLGSNKKTIVFTLTNNTDQNQTAYLFDSRSGQTNPNVGISPNIDMFNAELSNAPKKVSKFEFRNIGSSGFSNVSAVAPVPIMPTGIGKNPILTGVSTPVNPSLPVTPPLSTASSPAPVVSQFNQAEAPFKMNCKDASGNASQQQFIPMISASQFQKGMTTVVMNGEILDGECYMEYTMYPKSKVSIVVFYEDYKMSDLLTKKKDLGSSTSGELMTKESVSSKKETHPIKAAASLFLVGGLGYGAYKILSK